MLAAAGKVEGHALRSDAAGAHLVAAGKDVEHAGDGGDSDIRLALPAREPAAESGGVGNDVDLDAERFHAASDVVDGAFGVAGCAGDVDAVDASEALRSFCSPHARGDQNDLLRGSFEGGAQALVHDFGGDHVEVILGGRAATEEPVFTQAAMGVVACQEGRDAAGVKAEARCGFRRELVEQFDAHRHPVRELDGPKLRKIAAPVGQAQCFLLEFSGGVEPGDEAGQALHWRTSGERSRRLAGLGFSERAIDPEGGEKRACFVYQRFRGGNAFAQRDENRAEPDGTVGRQLCRSFVVVQGHAEGEELKCVLSTAVRSLGEHFSGVTGVAVEENAGTRFNARDPFGGELGDAGEVGVGVSSGAEIVDVCRCAEPRSGCWMTLTPGDEQRSIGCAGVLHGTALSLPRNSDGNRE